MVHNPPQRTSMLYSRADQPRIDNIFSAHLGLIKIVGQDLIKFKLPQRLQLFSTALSYIYMTFVISQLLCVGVVLVATLYQMSHNGNIEQVTDTLTTVIIYWFTIYTTLYWNLRRRRLLNFLNFINQNHWNHSLPGLTFVTSHPSCVLAKRVIIVWAIVGVIGVTSYSVAPLLTGDRVLPLNTWYPFDPLQPIVYKVVCAHHLLAQMIMGCVFASASGLFASLAIVLCGQFDVLFCSLKNLSYCGRLRVGCDTAKLRKEQIALPKPAADELNQYMYSKEHLTDLTALHLVQAQQPPLSSAKALHSALVQCVQLHRFLLDAGKEFEQLFSHYCLLKSIQITVQFCLLAFSYVGGERSSASTFKSALYLLLTFVDLFLFIYFGELLGRHSARCGEAYWRSQWWTHTTTLIRQDILIFLVNSKRSVKLTAGNIYAMDMYRLREVITQAFSFFTLLQKLAVKNKK